MTTQKILEKIPALLSWTILLIPFVFSFSYPLFVGIFIAIFLFFWFFRTMEYFSFLIVSYFRYRKERQKDFQKEFEKYIKENHDKKDFFSPYNVKHIIILATCGEDFLVLEETILSIKKSNFDLKKVILCLATEERMNPEANEIAKKVEKSFGKDFRRFFHFSHPDGIPGELHGKGGNITYSGQEVTKILEKEGENLEEYLVTTLDADNKPHQEYLNALTLEYVKAKKRKNKSYQPIPFFFNNIWEVPTINRMIAITGGFWHMIQCSRSYRLRNFSSHAQPLMALKEMNFWAVDTIVEDGHQYWRSYFHFHGNYSVTPVFIPIYQDAVMNKDYQKTTIAQYKQIRRWAWGCSDIPYVIQKWAKNFFTLPFLETLLHFLRLLEGHIFWATGAIIITLATPLPGLINPEYSENIFSANIAQMRSFIFNIAVMGIFIIITLSILLLPRPPKKIGYIKIAAQWFIVPIMTIFFGAIPALEAQTRLFFGKYLGFNVTEKVRKKLS